MSNGLTNIERFGANVSSGDCMYTYINETNMKTGNLLEEIYVWKHF